MRSFALATILSLLLTPLTGCGDGLAEVSGTVRIDGRSLTEGEIIFEEVDRTKPPEAAKIKDGTYIIRVVPGEKRILINASRPTSIPDPVMGAVARESMIPEEFNIKTKLTYQVDPGRHGGVDFDVTERP
jgi:hypothetical protein